MQLSCAHHGPHYTVQALRARGKRAVVLPHAFGLPAIQRPAWPRLALRSHDHQRAPRKPNVPPTILSRCYVPAASVQSSYLTLSGCKLFSQGRPGVRLERHQRRRQALRRQHGICGGGNHCDDKDSQPGTSAAATSTVNTTMHNPAAFHTAGVTATCATLARFSTRTTKAKRSCSRLSPPLPSLSLPATFKFVPHSPTKRMALPGAGV
jgi:hypothetical protein